MKIGVRQFILEQSAYVEEQVARVNTDDKPALSYAEGRQLPQDLQDNLTAHRRAPGTATGNTFWA